MVTIKYKLDNKDRK